MSSPFKHSIEVRFADCDMFGHVNNAVYLSYLEQARVNFLKTLGYDVRYYQTQCPVIMANASIDYKSPAYINEIMDVYLTVTEIKNASFVFEYEIKDQATSRLVAIAKTVIVTFDYKAMKVMPIPAEMRKALTTPPQTF